MDFAAWIEEDKLYLQLGDCTGIIRDLYQAERIIHGLDRMVQAAINRQKLVQFVDDLAFKQNSEKFFVEVESFLKKVREGG